MVDTPATLEQLVLRSRELYSLPAVAMEVLELTNHPKVDAAKLKACIERDPALTTKLLRVVNSSLFGLKQQVSDLNQALALLGIKPLKLLVLGFSLPDALFADLAGDVLTRYWKHTLTRAVAARELAERLWRLPGDEAFIAGLLEGLGMLVLIQELGAPYVDLLKKVTAAGDYLTAIERHALGFDHGQLTVRLLEDWKLPPSLVEAVAYCQQPPAEPAADTGCDMPALPKILHLAELLALLLADGRTDVLPLVLQLGQQYHQITEEQLKSLVADLQEKVGQLADVLSLSLPDDLAFRDVVELAHEQLVEVASHAAGDMVRSQFETVSARIDSLKLLDEVRSLSEAVAKFTAPKRKREVAPAAKKTATAARPAAAGQPAGSRDRAAGSRERAAATTDLWSAMTDEGDGPAGGGGGFGPSQRSRSQTGFEPTDVDPSLLGRLIAAVGASRHSRCALSLLMVELDHYADLVFQQGLARTEELLSQLEQICRDLDHPQVVCLQVREARLAVVLVDCDRRQAVSLGNELLQGVRDAADAQSSTGMTISVGSATVALPPRNFLPQGLVSAADRCLYGARVAGGDSLKSIEIY